MSESPKTLMYEATGINSKTLVVDREHAKIAMQLMKLYGERVVDVLYDDVEQIDRNIRMVYASVLRLEPMTDYSNTSEIRIATAHIRDIVLCMAPLLCVPKSTFPGNDAISSDLKEIVYTVLKQLVETAVPSPSITGSFGDLTLCHTILDRVWTQMIMDGVEETEEKEARGMFMTVWAEMSSIVHSMFGKFVLDFEEVYHELPSTEARPVDEWSSFQARYDKSYSASKGA